MKHALTVAFVIGLAGMAHAQGGFGKGDGMRERDRIPWVRGGMERALGGGGSDNPFDRRRLRQPEPGDKKYIFVYIRATDEAAMEPREVSASADAHEASRGAWQFVLLDFDKENPYQKAWKVTGAPACIGADMFGNDFIKVGGATIDNIRTVLKNTPDAIARYEAKLKSDYQKATDQLKTDEEKGAKLIVDICLYGKTGYKEVAESHTKLGELTDPAFRKGELATAVSADMGAEYFEEMVKVYRTTPPGAKAEVFLALLDHARGNVQPAIQRLLRILKYDPRAFRPEMDAAQKALEDISKAGDLKIEAALAGDKSAAKDVLRKLAKDYQGTDASLHAAAAAK
jgi:hypothetical protein